MLKHGAIDITGKTYGWLTVLRREGSLRKSSGAKYAAWRCRCTCGKEVVVIGHLLRRGARKACAQGHFWAAARGLALPAKYPREYGSWEKMRNRCSNKRNHKYYLYGARGIRVCERWNSFVNFFEDMGPKPTPKHTIDRYPDNAGNYEPGNCRWATPAEQSRNMRNNVYVEWNGQRVLLMDIIPAGVTRGHVYQRLRIGWPLELALAQPVRRHKKKPLDVAPKTT